MRVLFVTLNVLGDAGANAAELFPRHAALHPRIDRVITADQARHRRFVHDRQFAQFLRLRPGAGPFALLRNAWRLARAARHHDIDVIHVFYRLRNVPLVVALRLALLLAGARARILVDHRSVNLARGPRALRKWSANLLMQAACHHLAGNPHAVETNHLLVWRRHSIIDLGYDAPPPDDLAAGGDRSGATALPPGPAHIWFVGSLRPANRKTGFLIEMFARLSAMLPADAEVTIHVAGPARPDQIAALRGNSRVHYHGRLPRADLYALMRAHPGIGVAFMNRQFHARAPSLKFCEYAMLRFPILASDTPGLRTQARRMAIPVAGFIAEDAADWAVALARLAVLPTRAPRWTMAADWSYGRIFARQVLPLYEGIARPRNRGPRPVAPAERPPARSAAGPASGPVPGWVAGSPRATTAQGAGLVRPARSDAA